MIGTGISHYRIIDQLGRGGMGIVYKAEDTKLDRTVALKLLPPHALASEDDRARFYREARAAAALNHTNIAHVYEIDEVPLSSDGGIPTSGGTSSGMAGGLGESRPFIAMEYIDGRTISDLIAKGPVPLKDAISYVSQIAEGLKAAHEAGVVHRDIKSGNIMLTSKGVVKILDFGLAKTAASTKLTQMGSTLGTVAYMSPEQAKGEEVDRRSDIWSTGVILYEMITGSLPFPGDYEQAIVYGILNEDPESLTTLRSGVPMALDAIMAKLLAKDRSLRYQHIDELPADLKAIDLDAVVRTSRIATTSMASRPATDGDSDSGPASTRHMQAASWWKRPLAWTLVLAAAVALGAAGSRLLSRNPAPLETSVKRLSLPIPGDKPITALDITPDGSLIVFVEEAGDPIRVLDLGNGSVRTLEGTEGASVLRVSPDGNWVMMTMISGVKRVSLFGGKPMSVVDATTEPGPYTAWGPDETLIYEDFGRLWIKPIVGGEPRQLTDQEQNESDHDWPHVLPDEKTMIATIEYDTGMAGIGMWDLETGERIGILEVGGYAPRWIPTGHLVFEDSGELIAVPFDLSSLKLAGVPVSLGSFVDARTFAVSRGGTFVSAEATATSVLRGRTSVINHVEIDGGRRTLSFEPQDYWDMQLSPDGSRLALEIGQGVGRQDVWVIGLSDARRHRLSFDNRGSEPVWSPDGDSVLYVERRVTDFPGSRLLVQSADGTGEPAVVYSESAHLEYPDWSADGRYIMFAKSSLDTGFDRGLVYNRFATAADSLMLLDTADRTIRLVSAGARRGRFSPDGRFIAYEHRNHVYVKPRTLDGGVWDVSDGPGFAPDWSGDGRHLFFNREFSIMRVDVAPQGSRVSFGNPREIVRLQTTELSYAPTADGNAFYVTGLPFTDAASAEDPEGEVTAPRSLDVVINWFEHVKRLSPAP